MCSLLLFSGYSILFGSVLFYSVLFFSVIFSSVFLLIDSIQFYLVLFFSILFSSILCYFILFDSTLFSSVILICSIHFCFILFYSILFSSVVFYSVLFSSIHFYSVKRHVVVRCRVVTAVILNLNAATISQVMGSSWVTRRLCDRIPASAWPGKLSNRKPQWVRTSRTRLHQTRSCPSFTFLTHIMQMRRVSDALPGRGAISGWGTCTPWFQSRTSQLL